MDLLFDDEMAPITSAMGFFETPFHVVAKEFTEWMNEIKTSRGICPVTVESRSVAGNLREVLRSLLPLTTGMSCRFLLIPTDSQWTAYLANNLHGTDGSAVGYLPRRIGCRSIHIVAIPHTLKKVGVPRRGRQGAVILTVHGPEETDFQNWIREIRAFNDAGRWKFDQLGTPFPFERVEAYTARRRRDRFTLEMMRDYLNELGMSPFEEDFYLPPGNDRALLVELAGDLPPQYKEYNLEQARARLRCD